MRKLFIHLDTKIEFKFEFFYLIFNIVLINQKINNCMIRILKKNK